MKTRKLWWRAAHRANPIASGNSYCCQDHFNLEEDLQNYRYLVTMGGNAKLKPGTAATATEENHEDGDNMSTLSEKTPDDNPTHSKRPPTRNIGIQILWNGISSMSYYTCRCFNTRKDSSRLNARKDSSRLNARKDSSRLNARKDSSRLNTRKDSSPPGTIPTLTLPTIKDASTSATSDRGVKRPEQFSDSQQEPACTLQGTSTSATKKLKMD
ncbi:hypothetical protein Pmani_009924 [Petrolisthes manimaculis]|uniref:THAP-type domain-containing protein n=1 Tax=Petrolisthes manimaculis TaxID=1843537 RepID=A0AAE1Q3Q6_9EUCA|nr:hypothetical protein Pmani_009924 [Petrolisthes manimaculis]